jgi:Protein of unknown function (DUF1569)
MKTLSNELEKNEILSRLEKIKHDSKRQWGKMTPHQMLCHLNDSFKGVIGEKELTLKVNIFGKTIVKWFALYLPLPWPKGLKTLPEMDQQLGGTPPKDFDKDLKELKLFIDRVTSERKDFAWKQHPIFGEMSETEWLRWAYLHIDHHLRQFGA